MQQNVNEFKNVIVNVDVTQMTSTLHKVEAANISHMAGGKVYVSKLINRDFIPLKVYTLDTTL